MKQPTTLYIGKLKDNKNLFFEVVSIQKRSSIIIICDENTKQFVSIIKDCIPENQLNNTHIYEIASGEENKTLQTVVKIWDFLSQLTCRRDALLINLGGGVITDMGGFVAATYKRGIDFINVPTTLLAMVDAAVGGKTGIDYLGYKNQIGAFYHPTATFIDADFLKTLPKEQLFSGFAEVLKHGLIADSIYWNDCTQVNFDSLNWNEIINKSISIKEQIVQSDPFEKGDRKKLNFGHTIGHAIESYFLSIHTPILHGYAVAVGMICESFISFKKGLLSQEELNTIADYLKNRYNKIIFDNTTYIGIIEFMKQDKKNTNSSLNVTLICGIGNANINYSVNENEIIEALNYYCL
jgi:3-dehydroquinate synthase